MQWSRGAKQACLGGEILEFSLPPWENTTSGPGKARGAFAVCPRLFHTHPGWSRVKPSPPWGADLQDCRQGGPCAHSTAALVFLGCGLWAVGWCGSPQPQGAEWLFTAGMESD